MKRTLLLMAGAFCFSFGNAQQVIADDDLEGFADGDYLALNSDVWSTWSGTAGEGTDVDTFISTEQAHSGVNSAKFVETDLTNGGPTDIILPMFQNAGVINISFWMYIPTGNAGYFNIQEAPQPGTGWAFECSFKDDGTVETIRDAAVVGSGTFSHDEWFEVEVMVDLDIMGAQVFVNDAVVGSMGWDGFCSSINFFASGNSFGPGLYYLDDVYVENEMVSVAEVAAPDTFDMFPNPANESVTLDLDYGGQQVYTEIYSLTGELVYAANVAGTSNVTIPTQSFEQGIYLVKAIAGNSVLTQKLVVKR